MPVVDADEYLEDEVDASWADDSLPWRYDAGDDATEERPPDVQGDELAAVDKAARLEQMGVYKEIKESDIGDSVVLTCKMGTGHGIEGLDWSLVSLSFGTPEDQICMHLLSLLMRPNC